MKSNSDSYGRGPVFYIDPRTVQTGESLSNILSTDIGHPLIAAVHREMRRIYQRK